MRSPVVPLLLGLALLGGSVFINVSQRRLQEDDVRGLRSLRATLDSTRNELARATTAAESTSLARTIAERRYFLERREFHLPSRQAGIDAWWTLRGPGTWIALGGVLLMAGAGLQHRRASQH